MVLTGITCHVLKIPHHGAWPKNASELVALLEHADPEMAVLSVGSRNTYGHVRPELFRALLGLQDRHDRRLRTFAWKVWFGNLGLGTFAWEFSLGYGRLGTVAYELSLGNVPLGPSLGNDCFATFA